ncbi:hypothetical protein [Novosphingobium resinovorum]|uniref:hypothetical protein n=1 Tax=Novosphingobium resinovorum TaxID=158500 RepID=UPI002ED44745|nr:hypothetical protein [Novosphingobium resinovorum]
MNRKVVGYIVLIAMLPLAIIGILTMPNEYRAMGADGIDCDGPVSVLIFAVPALVIYGISSAIFLFRFRRRRSLLLGCICGLICAGLIWNIGNAVGEFWRNSGPSACGAGL